MKKVTFQETSEENGNVYYFMDSKNCKPKFWIYCTRLLAFSLSLSLKIVEQKWGVSSKRLRFSSPSLLCLIAFLHFSTVGDSSTNGKSSGGRQLVPGLLRLPDTNKYNGTAYRQNQGNQTLIWSTFIYFPLSFKILKCVIIL